MHNSRYQRLGGDTLEWGNENIRYVFSTIERSLPLYLESIGYSAWERIFQRPEGYPYYHWLHTLEGEGHFELLGEAVKLTKGKGVLLTPFTPHSRSEERRVGKACRSRWTQQQS